MLIQDERAVCCIKGKPTRDCFLITLEYTMGFETHTLFALEPQALWSCVKLGLVWFRSAMNLSPSPARGEFL